MRHNGRPVMRASRMNPSHLDLSDRFRAITCPDCGRWCSLARKSRVIPHQASHADPYGVLCPGTGQRVHVDLTPDEWRQRLDRKLDPALVRPASGPVGAPAPPVAPAVCQLAAR